MGPTEIIVSGLGIAIKKGWEKLSETMAKRLADRLDKRWKERYDQKVCK